MVGAKYLNTIANGRLCTVGFSAIMAIISFICSLSRTFDTLLNIASFFVSFTLFSVCLTTIFAAIEDHPANYTVDPSAKVHEEPVVLVLSAAGTSLVSGMNAYLNISCAFISQITISSFIAEIRNPEDFPKGFMGSDQC